jgi:ribose/xylose/arabinose/galactoside ABC-type transport system permease subunit
MSIDTLIVVVAMLLAMLAARVRKGDRPAWAKRLGWLAVILAVVVILTGWVVGGLYGAGPGIWVVRLSYIPLAVTFYTDWVRED